MKLSSAFYKRNLSLIYLILSIFFSLTMVNVPVKSDPYETRLFIRESPPGSWIDGGSVSTYFYVIVDIESPIAWDNTANGIVGWVLSVHVDPNVLEFYLSGAYTGTVGYFLYDFVGWYEFPPYYEPQPFVEIVPPWNDTKVGELILGYGTLGVGAGGSSGTPGWYGEEYGLCRLRLKSLSETAHTLIDIYNAYWVDTNGTQHAFDVVDDGHYNQPEVPAPDLTIEGIVLPYISPVPLIYPTPDPEFYYEINVTVTNEGTADTGSFNVSFSAYWEDEEMPESWEKKTIASLQQGEAKTVLFDFRPENYGNYTLIIMADCDNDVAELDEANNIKMTWVIGTIAGDLDGDGDVDFDDFIIFAGKYGRQFPFPPYPTADIDWDGDVDFDDFIILAGKYGQSI